MNTRSFALALAACGWLPAPASSQVSAASGLQAEIVPVTVSASTHASASVAMPVHVFKPTLTQPGAGAGPWPVVIFSHGRSGTASGRAAMKSPVQGYTEMLSYWHGKGYAVVAAVRPGYGQNTAEDPEDHGARWEGSTCAGPADFSKTAGAAARAVRSVHAWVLEQSWANKERILLMGQSVGGLATVAACGQNWPGVVGCINFVGGAGGNPQASPGASCRPDRLGEQLAIPAKTTKVPSLWLYSANDKFWGEQAPRDWHKAYLQAATASGQGARSEFVAAPAVGENGHSLLGAGSRFWIPAVDKWLQTHGF
jgi:dienelactone hydrolase